MSFTQRPKTNLLGIWTYIFATIVCISPLQLSIRTSIISLDNLAKKWLPDSLHCTAFCEHIAIIKIII